LDMAMSSEGFGLVAIFDSPLGNLQRHTARHAAPSPILADEHGESYLAGLFASPPAPLSLAGPGGRGGVRGSIMTQKGPARRSLVCLVTQNGTTPSPARETG